MIRFVIALREEAQPLIERLGLRGGPAASLYPVFVHEDCWLTISGVGRAAAAAATANLFHLGGGARDRIWINAGVAGHPHLALGEMRAAHCVHEAASGRRWYPPPVLLPRLASAPLTTVDSPLANYPQEHLYDMEAAGFLAAALRCASAETVQCIKVISDNRAYPLTRIDGRHIEDLMQAQSASICAAGAAMAQALSDSGGDPAFPDELDELCRRHRFSVSQRTQLQNLLRRLRALAPAAAALDQPLLAAGNARQVLQLLRQRIDAMPVVLGPP